MKAGLALVGRRIEAAARRAEAKRNRAKRPSAAELSRRYRIAAEGRMQKRDLTENQKSH